METRRWLLLATIAAAACGGYTAPDEVTFGASVYSQPDPKASFTPLRTFFLDPKLASPKAKIAWTLAKRKLGMRSLMEVIPLDATLVKGSHGLPPPSREDSPVLIGGPGVALDRDEMDATEVFDLNTGLMTADGDLVYIDNFICAQATTLASLVKHLRAEQADNPGFAPGDVFLCNDPYVSVCHQTCVQVAGPIYHGDDLVAWTGASLHAIDTGGPTAGQVQLDAVDIHGEQPLFGPVKVVEGGRVRRDVEGTFLKNSRLPDLLALDLRAKVAAQAVVERFLHQLGLPEAREPREETAPVGGHARGFEARLVGFEQRLVAAEGGELEGGVGERGIHAPRCGQVSVSERVAVGERARVLALDREPAENRRENSVPHRGAHQSEPNCSPPAMVIAAASVSGLMEEGMNRTEPSAIAACTPLACMPNGR